MTTILEPSTSWRYIPYRPHMFDRWLAAPSDLPPFVMLQIQQAITEIVEDRPPYLTEFCGADVCGHVKSADEFFSTVLGTNGDAAVTAIGTVPHLGGFGQRIARMMKHSASAATCKGFQKKMGAFA